MEPLHQELRNKVIEFYGGKCMNPKCLVPDGCTDRRCLQIDHIDPVMGKHRTNGITLYMEILQKPVEARQKYQLLCANCNWIKRAENKEIHLKGYKEKLRRDQTPAKHINLFLEIQKVLGR